MSDGTNQAAIDTAKGLTDALGTMSGEVRKLRKRSRRNLLLIIFDIGLTVIVAAGFWQSRQAQQDAVTARVQSHQAQALASAARPSAEIRDTSAIPLYQTD